MRIWEFTEDAEGKLKSPDGFDRNVKNGRAVALGYFDGVHRGHRKILDKLNDLASERSLLSMVHTFSSLPKSKTEDFQSNGNLLLTTLPEKCAIFERLSIDEISLFPFSQAVSSMHATDFMQNILINTLRAKVIIAGEDYRFGRDREGDMDLLTSWGKKNDVQICPVPPLHYGGRAISSTRIRQAVGNGKISLANKLLGYPISYEGTVRQGKQLGRTLGFPTANLIPEEGKVVPAYGVYASLVYTNGSVYHSITSIGLRPTVNRSDLIPLVETMLYDHTMDLYGQKIRVFLLSFVRPELRFPDIHALKEQVNKDMAEVRHYHDLHECDYSILLTGVI